MKICLYTDNHYSQYSSILRLRGKKYSIRLENQIESLNWVNRISKERGCDKLICLGDFFDSAILNSEEISALKEIRWNDLPKTFIVGNHEMGSADLSLNSTNALNKIGEIIDTLTFESGDKYELIYLPYILETNRQPLDEYIKNLRYDRFRNTKNKNVIILSHNDIKGIQYGNIQSKTGFTTLEIENWCDLFINGHLHNGDKITNKIINLGNLTGQNFGEDGFKYKHNIMILDTETLQYELIENPYALKFYKIEIENIEELKNILNKLDNKSIVTFKVPNDILKECKEIITNTNILTFKLLGYDKVIKNNSNTKSIKELTDINHIQMFNDYFIEKYGKSDIILEELSYLR